MNKSLMAATLAVAVALVGCVLIIPGEIEENGVDATSSSFSVTGAEAKDSISATVSNMSQNGTAIITLNNNVTESNTVTINNGKSVTINLNGHKLTTTAGSNGYAINIAGNATLTFTGDGTVNGQILANGGSITIDENAKVVFESNTLIQNNGTMTISGMLTLENGKRITNNSSLLIDGTLRGGNVSGSGTVTMGQDSNTYLTTIKGNVSYVSTNPDIHVNVTKADEQWLDDNAIVWAINRDPAVYKGHDIVVTVEGSNDPSDPNVYTMDGSPNNIQYRGGNLILQAEEGTYAVVKIKGDKATIKVQNSPYEEQSITIRNLAFTDYGTGFASLELSWFNDVIVEDCTFTDTRLFRSTTGTTDPTLMGSMTVTGSEFRCTGDPYDSAAVTAVSGSVVFENNTIDNYGSGLIVNIGYYDRADDPGEPRDGEVRIRNNTMSNLQGDTEAADGTAVQIGGRLNGLDVSVSNNSIHHARCAVQLAGNSTGSPVAFDVSENRITSTPVGIMYTIDKNSKQQADIGIQADRNYFAPDGGRGQSLTVESEGSDVSDLVQSDIYYTDSDMNSVTNGSYPPWTWDDEDDYPIYPTVSTDDSSDDDTVTVVACAAAAVVAALMAVFLIIDRKGN